MRTIRILALLGILVPVAACDAESPQSGGDAVAASYKIEEVFLGPIPSGVVRSVVSGDGCHVAFVVARGDKQFVVVDCQPGPEYDWILKDTLVFSLDGKRVAYGAWKGGKWVVVVDGQAGPEYDGDW